MKSILFENALKNSNAYTLLKKDIFSNIGHAYMVVSPDDEAVFQFFRLIGQLVMCDNQGCSVCNECKKVADFCHPNVFWTNNDRTSIKVEHIKELTSQIYIKGYDYKQKLFFVNRADQMNVQAQNKLLKTLEEPPENTTLFLGCSNLSAMKDTIKSRCKIFHLDNFSNDIIKNELLKQGIDNKIASIASCCSDGEIGTALKISNNTAYLSLFDEALNVFLNMKKSTDMAKFLTKKAIPKNLEEYLNVFSIILSDIMKSKHDKSKIMSKHIEKQILHLGEEFSDRAIAEIQKFVVDAKQKIYFHASPVIVLESLYFGMLEVKHKWQ